MRADSQILHKGSYEEASTSASLFVWNYTRFQNRGKQSQPGARQIRDENGPMGIRYKGFL